MSNYFPFGHRAGLRTTFSAGLIVLAAFALVPAVGVLVLSFTDIRSLPYLPVDWVGLQNYLSFFSPAHLPYNVKALSTTVVFAVSTTIFQNVFALLIAVLLNRRLRGSNFYRSVVFLPTVLGVTVIGLIWSLIFNPSGGPAATVWSWFGTSSSFLGDQHLALGLLVLVQVWMSTGVAVVIYLAGLQAIPAELYETSSIDGATGWQKLRLVTIPLLAPSITANVLLCIVTSLQSYQLAYVLTGPNNPATQLLSLVIFTQGFGGSLTAGASAQTQGYAAAISIVQFVLVGVISLVVLAYLRKREQRL